VTLKDIHPREGEVRVSLHLESNTAGRDGRGLSINQWLPPPAWGDKRRRPEYTSMKAGGCAGEMNQAKKEESAVLGAGDSAIACVPLECGSSCGTDKKYQVSCQHEDGGMLRGGGRDKRCSWRSTGGRGAT
jgi:hypothetical protein